MSGTCAARSLGLVSGFVQGLLEVLCPEFLTGLTLGCLFWPICLVVVQELFLACCAVLPVVRCVACAVLVSGTVCFEPHDFFGVLGFVLAVACALQCLLQIWFPWWFSTVGGDLCLVALSHGMV